MSIPEYSLIQSFQTLQKLQESQIRMNASHDLASSEPTKRVRIAQQEYANISRGLVIPTPKKQTIQNEDLIQASQTLEMIKRKQIEEQINQQMIQQYRIRQQLLQQLGYQQSDYVFQQHMMKVAQDMPKQVTTVQNQDKLLLSEVKETQKIELPQSSFEPKIMEQEWSDTFVKTKGTESPIKLEDLERTSGTSGVHSEDEIAQINSLEKQQKAQSKGKEKATKAKKAPVKAKESKPKKVEYVDYYQTPLKEKSETRRKNKWQLQAEQQLEGSAADGQGANVNTQAAKAQQEEANVDYEYFQSITITNDPAKIGEEKAAKGFVVITRDTPVIKTETGPKETSVGSRYQAVIPEINQKTTRRRNAEQSWNPDMIYKEKVTEYCENLKKILKCDHINEERALKLLTRKNYQSEKVEVNISKNEKFYSGFLVVHDLKAADVVENISQEGQQHKM